MVAKQFFFDDWNNIWRVEKNSDGSESFIRETFELASPDTFALTLDRADDDAPDQVVGPVESSTQSSM
jgi:hypothetical protein